MKKTLKEFDSVVDEFVDAVKRKSKKLSFNANDPVEFVLNEKLTDSVFDSIKPKQKGVYLFEIQLANPTVKGVKSQTKLANFVKQWGVQKTTKFLYSPNVIEKRLVKYQGDATIDWLPIYIGKNKDIRKRVLEHINLDTNTKTYAMKLKERQNLYGNTFRASYINVDVRNYDFIVPFLEKILREYYNPIIGKQ